jgi:hypothetical protein
MNYPINANNVINWLRLLLAVGGIDEKDREDVLRYIKRTDRIRRQKELDKIFGGEEW